MDKVTLETLANFDSYPDSAWVRAPVVQALFGGVSDEGVRRLVAAGRIPRPVKILGGRVNFWQIGGLRKALRPTDDRAVGFK